jgi:glutathione S-transferase
MTYTLYTFRRCPYAMRARMAVYAADISFEAREISLKNKPVSLLSYSPKGTVPVFVGPNFVLDESFDIMQHALSLNDPQGWLAIEPTLIQHFLYGNDRLFKPLIDGYKYKSQWSDLCRDQATLYLAYLNQQIEKNNGYLADASFTIADALCFPFVRQFWRVDEDWSNAQPYAALKNWYNHISASNLWTKVMTKHDLWKETK